MSCSQVNHSKVAIVISAIAFCCADSCAQEANRVAGGTTIRLVVQDRSGRHVAGGDDFLWIASSDRGWDPRGFQSDAFRHRPADWGARSQGSWTFTLPSEFVEAPGCEFKFTRGGWDTVEVDENGVDIPNRASLGLFDSWNDRAFSFSLAVEGFADQRGTRWPHLNPAGEKPSTVTGQIEIQPFASRILGGVRNIRVWLPPLDVETLIGRYPVLYLNDGQNLFDATTSFAGEWRADETATELIEKGAIPPLIIVGVDNAGDGRLDEYSPVPIGPDRPGRGGNADTYIRFLVDELMPCVNERYRTLPGPENTFLGGSSLGGIVTLHAAMTRPGVFGGILVESPSLWIGDGVFLERACEQRDWPQRVLLAIGTSESGRPDDDARAVAAVERLAASMREAGLDESRLHVVIEEGGKHNEAAWAKRLPGALEFLLSK